MQSSHPARILVVANRTASTPQLLEEVGRRAQIGPCSFALLIPDSSNRKAADWTMEVAIPLLEGVARGKVQALIGGPDPLAAVERAIHDGDYDEVIVSTLPPKRSWWLRRDLVRRIEGLGLPVTAVIPGRRSIIDGREKTLRARVGGGGA